MLEQLHPLRNKQLNEIFPVLNYFKNEHQNEQDDIDGEDPELAQRDSGIFSKVTGIAKKGLNNIEKSTYKNKYIKKFARNTGSVFNKIQSSDDPMSELGPGISTYH